MSGTAADMLQRHDAAVDAILIGKPFDPDELARKVARILQ